MALDLASHLAIADTQLKLNGLYTEITFKDVVETAESYDPITGEYSTTRSTTHTLSGVILNTNHNVGENNYNVTTEVIVLPQYVTFPVVVDQVYTIKGERWQLIRFTVAPQDSLYTLTLGRK